MKLIFGAKMMLCIRYFFIILYRPYDIGFQTYEKRLHIDYEDVNTEKY
jgi:hypothetical protein